MIAGGSASINANVRANGAGEFGFGGEIFLQATSVTTGGSSTWSMNGSNGGDAGLIEITASDGDISISGDMTGTAGAGGFGGVVTIVASSPTGNVTINGNITLTSGGEDGEGGELEIEAGVNGMVTIGNKTLSVRCGSGNCDSSGTISLSACKLEVNGTLNARNGDIDGGGGSNIFTYRDSFTCSGSNIRAEDDGGNFIECRCVDEDPEDGVCDSPPTCAASAPSGCSFTGPVITDPVWLGPCVGCHNGVVDPDETCDDGNFTNCDGCDNTCKTGCGSGVVCPGEQCDDGNTEDGDCCSSTCQFEQSGSTCESDGLECTDDVCDGAGTCTHPNKSAGTACSADENHCTKDECDGAGNCAHPCDVGKQCEAPCPIEGSCVENGSVCECQ
jgi:cysteine-rich repeat protein